MIGWRFLWLVHEVGCKCCSFIQEAGTLIFARLRAGIAGFDGGLVEAHALDQKHARKVRKVMRGRVLTGKKALVLLDRMG